MIRANAMPVATPFFLGTDYGERFCLYYPPAPDRECQGAVLHVPPFGEELNKARRMSALQARALSSAGYGALLIDLFGCADSDGELRDATWERWKDDLHCGVAWLGSHVGGPLCLWGTRLGALLALDFANEARVAVDRLILWQPVQSGEAFLTQFLRLRVASAAMQGDQVSSPGVRQLRGTLANEGLLEVAGYDLTAALATAIDALRLEDVRLPRCPVDWFEVVPEQGRGLSPAAKKTIDAWARQSSGVRIHLVTGPAFWATQEITECPALVAATCDTLAGTRP